MNIEVQKFDELALKTTLASALVRSIDKLYLSKDISSLTMDEQEKLCSLLYMMEDAVNDCDCIIRGINGESELKTDRIRMNLQGSILDVGIEWKEEQ